MASKGRTIEKYIRSSIDNRVSVSNSTENIRSTTINGWRSLHMNQMFKFGYGDASLNSNIDNVIGSPLGDPIAGP